MSTVGLMTLEETHYNILIAHRLKMDSFILKGLIRQTGARLFLGTILIAFSLAACESSNTRTNTKDPILKARGDSLYAVGDSFYYKDQWEKAIKQYQYAVANYLDAKDSSKLSNTVNDIGLCFKKLGKYDSAEKYYLQAYLIDSARKDTVKTIGRLTNLGNLYRNRGLHSDALEYFLRSQVFAMNLQNPKYLANIKLALGNVYQSVGNSERAIKEYQRSKIEFQNVGDTVRIAQVLNNIGVTFESNSNFDSSLVYYQKAKYLKERRGDNLSLAHTLNNIGSIYVKMKNYDSAEFYLSKAYQIKKITNSLQDLAATSNQLAKLYLFKQLPSVAKPFLDESREYALEQNNNTIIMDNLQLYSQYFKQIGRRSEAYDYLLQWSAMRDSLFNQEKVKVIELQSQHDLQRKEIERQLEEARADTQSRLADNRLFNTRLATAIAATLLLFTLAFLYQRNKIRQLNVSLRLVNRDMLHRKRNDYTRLLTSLEGAGFSEVDTIRSMLFASTAVDNTLYQGLTKEVNVKTHLESLIQDLSDSLQTSEKNIQINSWVQDIMMKGEQLTKISFIICELITNSVKHSFRLKGGTIKLELNHSEKVTTLYYSDDGVQVPDDVERVNTGMGQQLINGFLKSLKAKLVRSHENGKNTAKIEFST